MVWFPMNGTARCGIMALLIALPAPARAQITPSNPIFQQERPGYQTSIDPSGNMIIRLRNSSGKPCISVRGFVRQNIILNQVIEHMVEASNICARLITIKVCYFKTQYCKEIIMNSFARKVEQMGAMKGVTYFTFSFTETDKQYNADRVRLQGGRRSAE